MTSLAYIGYYYHFTIEKHDWSQKVTLILLRSSILLSPCQCKVQNKSAAEITFLLRDSFRTIDRVVSETLRIRRSNKLSHRIRKTRFIKLNLSLLIANAASLAHLRIIRNK